MAATDTLLVAISLQGQAVMLHSFTLFNKALTSTTVRQDSDSEPTRYLVGLVRDPASNAHFYSLYVDPTAAARVRTVRWRRDNFAERSFVDTNLSVAFDLAVTSNTETVIAYSGTGTDTSGDSFLRVPLPARTPSSPGPGQPAAANEHIVSLTSDTVRSVLWALDSDDNKIYAYNSATGERLL